jgi:hypothetical protein
MFRGVVILLVAWTLLLPPGVCVCHWLTTCQGCATQPSEEPACSCCHEELEPLAAVGSVHGCQPGQEPADHVPACPARDGTASWKSDRLSPLPQIADLHLSGLSTPVEERLTGLSWALSMTLDIAENPLYLTLLTLRI